MCNCLNLCTVFGERDLINGTSAHQSKISRDATPEAQERGCSGTTLCRCRLSAALGWTLLLRLYITIRCIITAVVALGATWKVNVVTTSNEDGARIGNKCTEVPKPCVRLCCSEVEYLAPILRVRTRRIARRLGIDEGPGATR